MASSQTERKPLHSAGGPIVDANFEPELFSKAEAMSYARKALKRSRSHGCKSFGLRDCGDYWRLTIF